MSLSQVQVQWMRFAALVRGRQIGRGGMHGSTTSTTSLRVQGLGGRRHGVSVPGAQYKWGGSTSLHVQCMGERAQTWSGVIAPGALWVDN